MSHGGVQNRFLANQPLAAHTEASSKKDKRKRKQKTEGRYRDASSHEDLMDLDSQPCESAKVSSDSACTDSGKHKKSRSTHALEDVEARTCKVNRWRERIPTTFDADELTMRLEYLQLDQDMRDVEHRLEKLVAITHQPASAPNATSAPVAENERPVPTPAPVALSTSAGTIKRSSRILRAHGAVARSGKNGKREIDSGTETTITGQKRSATSKTKASPTQPVVDGVLLPPEEVLLIAPTKKRATKADREQPANHGMIQPKEVLSVAAGPPGEARKVTAVRGNILQQTGTTLAQDDTRPPVGELENAAGHALGPSNPMPAPMPPPKSSLAPIQGVPSERSHIHPSCTDTGVRHSAALSSQDNRAKAGIHLGSFKPNDLFANPRLEPSSNERTQERINKTGTQSLPAPIHSPPRLDIEANSSSAASACRTASAAQQVEESTDRRKSASTKTSVLASNLNSHRVSAPSDSASTAPPAPRSFLGLCPSSLKLNDFFANGSSRPSLVGELEARKGKMASPTLPAPIQEASQPQLNDDMISSGDDVACRITTAARHVDESAGERKPASAKNPTLAPNMKATLASEPVGSASAASPAPRSSLSCADVVQGDEPSTDVGSQMFNIGEERASSRPPSLSYAQVSKQEGPLKPPNTFEDSHSHRSAKETGKRKDDIPSPYSVQEPFPIQPELGTVISRQEQLASETGPGSRIPQTSRSTSVQTRGPQAAIDIDIMNPRIEKSSDSGDASGPGTMRFYHRGEPGYYMTNFFHSPMFLDGQMYETSEAYFQSRKFPDHRWLCKRIASARSPRDALEIATYHRSIAREDWFQVNVQEMFDAVMLKFICNSKLATQLLNTGDAYLIEAAPRDRFWGEGDDRTGRNELGHVLMKVRAALRNIDDLRKQAVDEADGRTRETAPLPAPAPPIARAPASASTPVPSSAAPAPALRARPRNTSKDSHLHRSAEGAEARKDDTVSPYQPHSDPKALHSQPEHVPVIPRQERLASELGPRPHPPRSSRRTPAQTHGSRAGIDVDVILASSIPATPTTLPTPATPLTPATPKPSTPEPRSGSSNRSSTIRSSPSIFSATVGSLKRAVCHRFRTRKDS